jgi:hypothetical protein
MALECGTLDGMSNSLGQDVLRRASSSNPFKIWRPVTKEDAESRVFDVKRVRGGTCQISLPALFMRSQKNAEVVACLVVKVRIVRKSQKATEFDACLFFQVDGESVQVITSGGFPDFHPAEVPAAVPVRSLCDFFSGKVLEV